jgi:hypothetical protein
MSRKERILLFSSLLLFSSTCLLAIYLRTDVPIPGLSNTLSLEFRTVKCVDPVSIIKAEWQVSILVTNSGIRPLTISSVLVDGKPVRQYGLVHGDSLSNESQLGTSIPSEGLRLISGASENIYIWVGENMYTNDSEIQIRFTDPNARSMTETVTLIRYSLGDMRHVTKKSNINT